MGLVKLAPKQPAAIGNLWVAISHLHVERQSAGAQHEQRSTHTSDQQQYTPNPLPVLQFDGTSTSKCWENEFHDTAAGQCANMGRPNGCNAHHPAVFLRKHAQEPVLPQREWGMSCTNIRSCLMETGCTHTSIHGIAGPWTAREAGVQVNILDER